MDGDVVEPDAASGSFLDGAGPWVAEGANVAEGGAVLQRLVGSCVSACGEMLSDGTVSEAQFLEQLGEWSNPGALADSLNALQGARAWTGGYFVEASDAIAAALEGRIAAVLQAPQQVAHVVVVEAIGHNRFRVRDPAIGGTYEVTSQWIAKFVSGGVF